MVRLEIARCPGYVGGWAVEYFEIVYELSIKVLQRQIELDTDNPKYVDRSTFREMLRIVGEKGLVADVEAWFCHH